eukprot:2888604-Prymnesium_polylepis.1
MVGHVLSSAAHRDAEATGWRGWPWAGVCACVARVHVFHGACVARAATRRGWRDGHVRAA